VASGRNAEYIKTAVDFLESYQFDLLDINAGCPAHHTMQSGGGAALIRDLGEGTLETIIDTCVKYSSKPISVKTRLGYENNLAIDKVHELVETHGASLLTIHGRTAKQMYSGTVDLEKMKEIKTKARIPIIGNGDVYDYSSYDAMKTYTKCDAVMIGRAVMSNPRVFAQIWKNQLNPNLLQDKSPQTATNTWFEVQGFLQQIEKNIDARSVFWNNERFRISELRRLAIWFIKGLKGYKKVRTIISRINELRELREFIYGEKSEKLFKLAELSPETTSESSAETSSNASIETNPDTATK
jgi:tRNA-dihydrouridine synthase B